MGIAIERHGSNFDKGPTRADVLESLRFACLVESNPKYIANNSLLPAADRSNARWLRRFVTTTWLPQESMHGVIFREYLIRSGAMQPAEIDADIKEVQERGFTFGNDYTALQACTYGWIQEMITWRFYQSMQQYAGEPVLSQILNDVGKQENFHRFVYFTGAKTILKRHPDRKREVREVIETAANFTMPGHYMVPELQPQSTKWAKQFEFPFRTLYREISNGLVELVGHEGLGEIILSYGAKNAPWYLKAPLTPLRVVAKSPIPPTNRIVGKLADVATRKK